MNTWLLMCALKKHLAPQLETLPLPVRGRDQNGDPIEDAETHEVLRTTTIYLGSMPPTDTEAYSAAPFIVIQPLGGYDSEDLERYAELLLRLCIVSDDLEGAENDLQNLISLVRRAILSLPDHLLGRGKYCLRPQAGSGGLVPWERPDGQVYPFLQAHTYTTWMTQGSYMYGSD